MVNQFGFIIEAIGPSLRDQSLIGMLQAKIQRPFGIDLAYWSRYRPTAFQSFRGRYDRFRDLSTACYFFHLGQAVIGSTFFTRVYVNGTGTGIGLSGSSAPASYTAISANTPTLVVVKYDIATKVSSLYVLNSFSSTEPGVPNATFTETGTIANVGSVALRQYSSSQRVIVDGIRVGKTWGDAVTSGVSINATGTLSSLTTIYGTVSSNTSFDVSGSNLTAGSTIAPPIGFEVSTFSDFSSNVGNNSSPIVVGTGGTIPSTTVYVRLM